MVSLENFGYREVPLRHLSADELLVRVLYLAFEPSTRASLDAKPRYAASLPIGKVIRGPAIGEVVESKAPEYRQGDLVLGNFGWQDYAVSPGRGPSRPTKLPTTHSPSRYLGVLGTTGLTAYFGMLDVGKPKPGETVVVSAAAGATGSVAAQIAKLQGARVVGIAGGADKCRWLTGELGLDAAINYRAESPRDRLRETCPDGIHLYFDNVGGELLEHAIEHLAIRGRIVLCGLMSTYDTAAAHWPRNLFELIARRGRLEGFLVMDYAQQFADARRTLSTWLSDGKIAAKEDIQNGFENIPQTFLRLFSGANIGKQLLAIGGDSATP